MSLKRPLETETIAMSVEKLILPYLDQIRIPNSSSRIYKDECCFSFTTPESEGGLFVDLNSFLGFSKEYALLNTQKTGHKLYLHIKRIFHRKEESKPEETGEPDSKKPSVLGIGVPGGFVIDEQNWEPEDILSIAVLPELFFVPLTDPSIPEKLQMATTAILTTNSSDKQDELNDWVAGKVESKHAKTLKQLDNGVKVPPNGWKCINCDLTENLWMNLTDGSILCGRKNFDGSGGNGHALEHYQKTGFPLCVKLGTISADTKGIDIYSYDEDDMVLDSQIVQHLDHFGIKLANMEKTEKTIAEMEIDMNQNFDWSRIQESDKQLIPAYGPGFTGLINIGNSCYMASVLQTLFSLPEFQDKYATNADQAFKQAPSDPAGDFYVQMCKIGKGLQSGIYSHQPQETKEGERPPASGIAPRMLKSIVGKGHPEFSSGRQQDAIEYFQHLLEFIKKDEHRRSQGREDPTHIFEFEIEEKTACSVSGKVRYTKRVDNTLSLPIPLEKASNKEAVKIFEEEQQKQKEEFENKKKEAEKQGLPAPKPDDKRVEPVRPHISFMDCVKAFAESEAISGFYSTAINERTTGIRTNRLASFPKYLIVQMRKFTIGADWLPKKLDVFLDVPDQIDLEFIRGHGKQPNEELLPEESSSKPKIEINESIVSQLIEFGFPRDRCVKAVYNTKNSNAEVAMNWLMEHMEDPDIDVPLDLGEKPASNAFTVNEEAVGMIMSMGFPREKAIKALKATDNNLERASDWIFSHMDDDGEEEAPAPTSGAVSASKSAVEDGPGKYKLKAFISHMGTSPASGHYVCHIEKDGKWYIFNDQKVALSEDPPKDMGYLYLFQRV
eukprot:TRINITY_DN1635_c0_g1_i1.p1 TRINITY_DN1635_c0_g1~~TRINITY_DN1635_c0_g1_i1.p1  ORF type:complete len:838 (-),score=281.18 TRINITY_DN1635_c0_g1_i1:110-2623(-)